MPRKILVTGSSRGLGRALTEHLLKKGDTVYGCSRGESDLEHDNYTHFEVNLADADEVTQLYRTLRKHTKQLDAVVNNAGVASMNAIALTPVKSYQRIFDINVQATFISCQKALSLLRASKHPRIVNLSTVAVPMQIEGEAVYAASKSAVETFTKILAKEYGSFGITCNAIGPSPIDTALIGGLAKDKIQALVDRQAVKKMATPEDLINVVEFYLSPASDMISGQIIYLGGVS